MFLVHGRRLATPPSSEGALPGVARWTVLEIAEEYGLEAVEEPLPLADLETATEVFTTNVVRGPTPVVEMDGRMVRTGSIGDVTTALAKAYWARVRSGA